MTSAKRVVDEWDSHEGRGMDGSYRTSYGNRQVVIRDIRSGGDGRTEWIEVWTGGSKRPAFRIINPPPFVRDPKGSIVIRESGPDGKERNVRVREDPVEAVAEIIAGVRR